MLTSRKWVYEFAILFTTVISISGICEFKFLHEENKTDDGARLIRMNYPVKLVVPGENRDVLYVWPTLGKPRAADAVFDSLQLGEVILLLHPDSLIYLNAAKYNPARDFTGGKFNAKQLLSETGK